MFVPVWVALVATHLISALVGAVIMVNIGLWLASREHAREE